MKNRKATSINNANLLPSELWKKLMDAQSKSEELQDRKVDSNNSASETDFDYKDFDTVRVAEAVKARRKEQGLSEKGLAELAGVSRSTVQKIESGSTDVTLTNIRKIMKTVGLELAWK